MLKVEFLIVISLLLIFDFPKIFCYMYGDIDLNPKEESLPRNICPRIYDRVFWQNVPRGNEKAGNFEKKSEIHSIQECIKSCCLDKTCNVVFMFDTTCFHVECFSNYDCLPVYKPEAKFQNSGMVLVSPKGSDEWGSILHSYSSDDEYSTRDEEASLMDPTYYTASGRTCEIGVSMTCGKNEICESISLAASRSRSGICHCKEGYARNETGYCVSKLGHHSRAPQPGGRKVVQKGYQKLG